MKLIRPVWAEIDLGAVKSNLQAIKSRLAPRTQVMAVVKANAYGHGLIPVAKAALEAKADRLGVALVEEAIELRQAGIQAPLHILSEPPIGAAGTVVDYDLIPTVYTLDWVQALSRKAHAGKATLKVHLKVDTGMRRVGVSVEDTAEFYREIRGRPGLEIEGIFTHFAKADDPDDPFTAKQLKSFLWLRKSMSQVPIWHAANSAAALLMPRTHLDMVRIGIAMYGLRPTEATVPVKLKPALSLKTKIGFMQNLKLGEGVSYGLTYKADRHIKVAVLPIGYGDGYPRILSNKGKVLIGGRRVRIIGNICMDQLFVEVDGVAAKPGDDVVLIGNQGRESISAEEIATLLGTINYEVVCMINKRVPRIYLEQ